ncbi:hypothetical protein U1Q18_052865 [Sarracenia purpurea var. burkii]
MSGRPSILPPRESTRKRRASDRSPNRRDARATTDLASSSREERDGAGEVRPVVGSGAPETARATMPSGPEYAGVDNPNQSAGPSGSGRQSLLSEGSNGRAFLRKL